MLACARGQSSFGSEENGRAEIRCSIASVIDESLGESVQLVQREQGFKEKVADQREERRIEERRIHRSVRTEPAWRTDESSELGVRAASRKDKSSGDRFSWGSKKKDFEGKVAEEGEGRKSSEKLDRRT